MDTMRAEREIRSSCCRQSYSRTIRKRNVFAKMKRREHERQIVVSTFHYNCQTFCEESHNKYDNLMAFRFLSEWIFPREKVTPTTLPFSSQTISETAVIIITLFLVFDNEERERWPHAIDYPSDVMIALLMKRRAKKWRWHDGQVLIRPDLMLNIHPSPHND